MEGLENRRQQLDSMLPKISPPKSDVLLGQYNSTQSEVEQALGKIEEVANLWHQHDEIITELSAWLENAHSQHDTIIEDQEQPLEVRLQVAEQLLDEYRAYEPRVDELRAVAGRLSQDAGVEGVVPVTDEIITKVQKEGGSLEVSWCVQICAIDLFGPAV